MFATYLTCRIFNYKTCIRSLIKAWHKYMRFRSSYFIKSWHLFQTCSSKITLTYVLFFPWHLSSSSLLQNFIYYICCGFLSPSPTPAPPLEYVHFRRADIVVLLYPKHQRLFLTNIRYLANICWMNVCWIKIVQRHHPVT